MCAVEQNFKSFKNFVKIQNNCWPKSLTEKDVNNEIKLFLKCNGMFLQKLYSIFVPEVCSQCSLLQLCNTNDIV